MTAKILLFAIAFSAPCIAQTAAPQSPNQASSLRPTEAALDNLIRVDKGTLALTLPTQTSTPAKLLLHDFEFEGAPVPTDKLHLRQLAPGTFEITSIAYTVGEWRVRVRDSANYYGLGERFDTLNHAHTVVRNISQENPGPKGSSTAKPIPFFMSTTGYALWFDTTGDATFDMNAASNSDIIIDAVAEKLRILLFTGPTFPNILDSFTALAGRSILPPYWAFAPWLGHSYLNAQQASQDLDKARSLGLPASVILIDSPLAAADALAVAKYLHDEGYKLVLGNSPWMNTESSNYAEAAASGFFVKSPDGKPYLGHWRKGTGSLLDFTNPRAKLWWQDQLRLAIHAGADGFKDDDGEGGFVPETALAFADESDTRIMRNRYAVLYNNAAQEVVQKDLKGNGVLLIHSVTTGANGLGFLSGGDNQPSFSPENGLPTAVTAGLNAGLSGMPLWTAELAASTPDHNLFMRWIEYSAFSPIMEPLSTSNPWDYGDAALAVYRKFSILHMSLFPYRYAAAQQAAKTGMPIMRGLVIDYQNDEDARLARNEYLFGPDLLVAPIVDEGTQRTVYLPQGDWLDYWTGAPLAGARTIIADASIDNIPLYVRQGTILPKIPDDVMTLVPTSESGNKTLKTLDDRRVYEIFPATSSASITTTDFEARTLTRSGNTLTITGDSAAHIILRWRFQKPQSITINGTAAKIQSDATGPFVEFDHLKQSTLEWH